MAPEEQQTRILVIGGTGHLGRHIVAASARQGHPTVALVRDTAPSDPAKAALLRSFRDWGVALVKGDLYDHGSLVRPMKAADVVISALGTRQIADQTRLIAAIKEAGSVKRFFPSEFWTDVDRTGAVEPARSVVYASKAAVRRAVEAAGVPYTYVLCGYLAGAALPSIGQVLSPTPPVEEAVILGDGNTKVSYVAEEDVGTYTVRAATDPRAANRMLYVKPPANTVSHNELVSLWEKKTGRTFRRVYIAEDAVLRMIREAPLPLGIALSIAHAAYILGETNFKIEPSLGAAAGELYPDVKYTTVSDYLNRLLLPAGSSDRNLQGQ
ncbi:Isoflavone reductase-like protein IRL, partial [Dichanthelium oligosanthes]